MSSLAGAINARCLKHRGSKPQRLTGAINTQNSNLQLVLQTPRLETCSAHSFDIFAEGTFFPRRHVPHSGTTAPRLYPDVLLARWNHVLDDCSYTQELMPSLSGSSSVNARYCKHRVWMCCKYRSSEVFQTPRIKTYNPFFYSLLFV
jgi:hypothetical protein